MHIMNDANFKPQYCLNAQNRISGTTLSAALPGDKKFGIAFVGGSVNRALNEGDLLPDFSPCIHKTFAVQTAHETSFLHAGDLDFVFLIADLETDLPLAVLVATTLQVQEVFTCCIAVSPANPSGAQLSAGMQGIAGTYRKASQAIIPLSWAYDQAGIYSAIQVCTSISKSVLDASLLGIDFEDLCTQIFQPGFECAFESNTCLLVDTSPPLPDSRWVSKATAALVIVETPALHMHGVTRIARNSMNLVRAQMQPNAFILYAVTVNNTLQSQYMVSVLASKSCDQQKL